MKSFPFWFVSKAQRALFAPAVAVLFASVVLNVFAGPTEPYAVEVRGCGPAIVLIPGLGCSGAVWKTTIDALAVDHECHVFTLAGFGGEAPAKGPFLDTAEEALARYIETRHLEKPVLIGHSLGGLLALRLSARLHSALTATIVVDALPFYSGMQPGATPESAKQFAEILRTHMEEQPRDAFLAGSQQSVGILVTAAEDRARVSEWMAQSDQRTVARAMAEVIAFDGRPLLSAITCPVLVIEAGLSPGAVPEELYESQYAGLRGVKRIRVADARHFVMLDQNKRFLQEIQSFLQAGAR